MITTHILDTARGEPAAGVALRLYGLPGPRLLAEAVTNADGRCDAPLAAAWVGRYELVFAMRAYFAQHHPGLPDPPFLDEIVLRFGIAFAGKHYHVPLLVSPYGFSTYRGS